jgi:hypothetical protein
MSKRAKRPVKLPLVARDRRDFLKQIPKLRKIKPPKRGK